MFGENDEFGRYFFSSLNSLNGILTSLKVSFNSEI